MNIPVPNGPHWMKQLATLCCMISPLAAEQNYFRTFQEGSGVVIYGYIGPSGDVEIPYAINSKTVIRIHTGTFSNRSDITGVTIPSGVTDIGDTSFFECNGLTKVVFQPPSSVTRIGSTAFVRCSSLESVEIPSSVATIDVAAFYGCNGLKTVTISDGVTSIGQEAFGDCSSLENINFPPSVVNIGTSAFVRCGFKSLIIPATVTTIGNSIFVDCDQLVSVKIKANISTITDSLFLDCNSLASVEIPASVTSIERQAFTSCNSLTSVKIPASVTRFGDYAFASCTGMKSMIFMGNAPSMGYQPLGYMTSGCIMYYFDGANDFTSPIWMGFQSVNMGVTSPISPWLISNGFPYNANILEDPNGDGVNLLMAYALNLDPNQNLSGSLPSPVIIGNQMSLTFYAGGEGVSYFVESSPDLQSWSTTRVTLSALDASNCQTATVDMNDPSRFMRIVMVH